MRARLTAEAGDCLPASVDLSPGQTVTLGRSRDNTLVLRDELASRLHAKVYFEDGKWHVRDFGLNGTRVEGARIAGAVELADGEAIRIGEVVLRFALGPKPAAAPNPAAPITVPMGRTSGGNYHGSTKVHELPAERTSAGEPAAEESANR